MSGRSHARTKAATNGLVATSTCSDTCARTCQSPLPAPFRAATASFRHCRQAQTTLAGTPESWQRALCAAKHAAPSLCRHWSFFIGTRSIIACTTSFAPQALRPHQHQHQHHPLQEGSLAGPQPKAAQTRVQAQAKAWPKAKQQQPRLELLLPRPPLHWSKGQQRQERTESFSFGLWL